MNTIAVSLIIAVVICLASCAGTLPNVTPDHLTWASQRWPGTNMQDLVSGRRLYVLKCSGCHSLHSPDELSPQAWEKTVPEMMTRAKITKEEAELIVRYLMTVLETKEHPSGESAHTKGSGNHE